MELSTVDVYGRLKAALATDPALEAELLGDFGGTLLDRFGVVVPQPAGLVRDGDRYRLTLAGRSYELDDPRRSAPGELDEAELELVSGGADQNCGIASSPSTEQKPPVGRV